MSYRRSRRNGANHVENIRRPVLQEGEKHDLGDEIADVLWVLTCIANQTGVNLEEAIRKNIAKKTNRDKTRHIENEKLKNTDKK